MPLTYWTGFDCNSHVRHARCEKFATLDVPLLIDFQPDRERRMTELTILTVDDPGLFSRIAGAVAAAVLILSGHASPHVMMARCLMFSFYKI